METSAKYKWQVRGAVVLLFLIGFLAGMLATNLYHARQSPASAGGRGRLEQVIERLDLTPEQRTQVQAVLGDARAQLAELRQQSAPKFREVRAQTDDRLRAILTPEQWQQFQNLMGEYRDRRRRGKDRPYERP